MLNKFKKFILQTGCSIALFSMSGFPSFAEEAVLERQSFLNLMGNKLFNVDGNLFRLQNDQGWHSFAVSPFGSSTESLVEAYSQIDQSLAYSVARNATIDATVTIDQGVVSFSGKSLPSAWADIIDATRPTTALQRDRRLSSESLRWLFRPTGNRDRNGDRIYSREPSRYLQRYKLFFSQYVRLQELQDNEAWRYVKPFSEFESYSQAMDAVLNNWETSGYKREVESARYEFNTNARPFAYRRWSEANEKFRFFSKPFGGGLRVYDTLVLPSPVSWPGLVEWKNVRYQPDSYDGEFRFQIAIVDVERPWMDLDYIFDFSAIEAERYDVISELTEGTVPTFSAALEGNFVGYIDQIVIVRGIDWIDPSTLEPLTQRPFDTVLGKFSYPQSINVLGFVVHVLPDMEIVEETARLEP